MKSYSAVTGLIFAISTCISGSALIAQDDEALQNLNRDQLRAEIRQYLLDNPEVIFEAVEIYNQQQDQVAAQSDAEALAQSHTALYNDGFSVTAGNEDASITIVEFFDYNCGYCRQAFDPIKSVLAANDDVNIIYKEFPILRQESLDVAKIAMALAEIEGDTAYQLLHEAMMQTNDIADQAAAQAFIENHGYDWEAINARAQEEDILARIGETRALSQELGISGTPSFIIGDQVVRGFVPADAINAIIADLREKADS